MKLLLIVPLLMLITVVSGQNREVKLITPGEHLGFELLYFNDLHDPVKTGILPGESWVAVYADNGYFQTREETLVWDTAQNFTIQSDTSHQPLFYIQGFTDLVRTGRGTQFTRRDFYLFKPLCWSHSDITYTILYSDNPEADKLAPYKCGTIYSDSELSIFKGVRAEDTAAIRLSGDSTVKLFWTGDLNGDNEPDFFLAPRSHHETFIWELILSDKTGKGLVWKRVARFVTWS